MSYPTNITELSFAAWAKWFLIVLGFFCLFSSYQDVSAQKPAAEWLQPLAGTGICWVGAWAAWFFWQRNED